MSRRKPSRNISRRRARDEASKYLYVVTCCQPTIEAFLELGFNCTKLWNEVNYDRRQAYDNYQRIDWTPKNYKKCVPLVGSATAQQVINKKNDAWRIFLALKRLERNGKTSFTNQSG